MNEIGKWMVGWFAAHGVTALWFCMALLVGYIAGLARPLYCARCRKHMSGEEIFRSHFRDRGDGPEK